MAIAALWAAPAEARSPAGIRMLSCVPWEESEGGSVTYAARMHALPGTARMSLRISLYEKLADGHFEHVSAEGLDVWRRSRADAPQFRYEQRVRGLRQGGVYRAVVRYRWHDSADNRIERKRRRSPRCVQPGGLPNLRVSGIEVRSGDVEGTALYKVTVVNRGSGSARDIGVVLRVDGEVVDQAEPIELLEPNESRTLTFNGPVCRKRVRVVVDPKRQIEESREGDNIRRATCL
ncbi:MAG TPA: CARDB domain-containing protein [Thermoleophilaceae bacterium]|nr:CARDB domain-containing protein [Thermoleophilaceae bacterium]